MPEPTPGEPVVIFQDVRLGFEDNEVLRGISFEIEARETKVLSGRKRLRQNLDPETRRRPYPPRFRKNHGHGPRSEPND